MQRFMDAVTIFARPLIILKLLEFELTIISFYFFVFARFESTTLFYSVLAAVARSPSVVY